MEFGIGRLGLAAPVDVALGTRAGDPVRELTRRAGLHADTELRGPLVDPRRQPARPRALDPPHHSPEIADRRPERGQPGGFLRPGLQHCREREPVSRGDAGREGEKAITPRRGTGQPAGSRITTRVPRIEERCRSQSQRDFAERAGPRGGLRS